MYVHVKGGGHVVTINFTLGRLLMGAAACVPLAIVFFSSGF